MRIRFAKDETIVFASSSGHCNLDCGYCVVVPVVKHNPSLTYEDLRFMIDSIAGKKFFIFSGKGDFFAGYKKSDRLLARVLDHDDVNIALDVNGVVTHCFDDLSPQQLAKIRHINLTFHYRQLLDHKALKVWKQNALAMLRKADCQDFFVNIVLSPPERALWMDALAWYEEHIFSECGKKLILINDVSIPLAKADEEVISQLQDRFGPIIRSVRRGNFELLLKQFDHVSCPAGQSYFRLWNDGRIEACPNIDELRHCGNAKERTFFPRTEPFVCKDVRYCDCYHIASSGTMEFRRELDQPLSEQVPVTPVARRRGVVAWIQDWRGR